MSLQSKTTETRTELPLFRRLRTQLILSYLAVSIIPLALVGLWATYLSRNTLQEQVFTRMVAIRDLKASQLDTFFQSLEEDIGIESNTPWITEALQAFASVEDLYAVRLGYLGNPSLTDSGQNAAPHKIRPTLMRDVQAAATGCVWPATQPAIHGNC